MCDSLVFAHSCLFFRMRELPRLYFSLSKLQIQNCCPVVTLAETPVTLKIEFLISVSPDVDEQPL